VFEGETWGLCTSPDEKFYVTTGDDMILMKWDVLAKKRDGWCKHSERIRACDYSSDGKFIVAGDYQANIILIRASDFKIVMTKQSTFTRKDQWIEDLKIAPNNQSVAFGTHMGVSKVEIMPISDGTSLEKGKAYNIGFTSSLTHLDWTKDSEFIVANSQAYELYWLSARLGNLNNFTC